MKEEMTSFDVAALTPELNQAIRGSRINNIYQISPITLLLKLRQPSQPSLQLLIEAGNRIHLTSYTLNKPKKPPAFCMALRKYIKNGKITGIRQHEFERIVTINVTTREGEFQLVSELFGGGNIILVSPQNKILHALTYRRMRDRNVLRGENFQYPPPSGRNPLNLTRQDFGKIKNLGKLETVKALTRFLSIGGLYAEEILLRAQVEEKNAPCEALTEQEMDAIFDQLHQILSSIEAGRINYSVIINENGEWVDVVPVPLKKYSNFKKKMYETFNETLDEYYTEVTMKEKVIKVAEEVERELAKQKRILGNQQKALKDSREKMEQNRKIGDAVFSHLGELQLLLQKIIDEKREGKSWEQIVSDTERQTDRIPAIYFHSLEPQRLILHVSVEKLVFSLNLRHSTQANAANYYAKAKKAERKLKGIEKAMRETQIRIQELKQARVKETEKVRKTPIKRRKKAWYEKFRWFYSSEGFLVIGGRDATTNEILIKKHVEPHDVVLHADIHGAPFVLIKTEGKTPPEQTIKESAQFAASYSRGWREGFGAVSVYWIFPQQVSKRPQPGRRLEKGAFMIHGPKNYVRNVPLQVAIGVKTKGELLTIIGGPVEAISKETNIYVEIIPGDQSAGRLAKQIRHLLAEKVTKASQKQILEISLDEIQRFVPLGRGVVKSKD